MALSAQHRSILYNEFVDRLGADVTEAFLAEFPARDGDDPITKDFLRGEIADVRGQLRGEMAALASDLRQEMSSLSSDLRGEMSSLRSDLRQEMSDLSSDLRGEMSGLRNDLRQELSDLSDDLRGEMSDLRSDLGGQMTELQLRVAALDARIAESEATFHKDSKRQLAVIVTAILGTGTAVLAGMAVSVAVIVSQMG